MTSPLIVEPNGEPPDPGPKVRRAVTDPALAPSRTMPGSVEPSMMTGLVIVGKALKGEMSKKTALKLAKRRAQVADLYHSGLKQYEIAKKLKVNEMMISRDLDAIQKGWEEAAIRDFNLEKGRILCELAHWRRELSASCEESKKKRGYGNPRFADLALVALAQEAEILGITGNGEPSTAPPVVGFRVHQPDGSIMEAVVGTKPPEEPPVYDRQRDGPLLTPPALPPGIDPDEARWATEG